MQEWHSGDEATAITRPSGESVQSEKSVPIPTGDATILRDSRARGKVKGEARKSGVMEVKGTGVSGRMVGSAVDARTNMRTEENLLDLETLAKAEAQLQAVVGWEEDAKMETVSTDETAGEMSDQVQLEAFTLLSPLHTGLLQAGES